MARLATEPRYRFGPQLPRLRVRALAVAGFVARSALVSHHRVVPISNPAQQWFGTWNAQARADSSIRIQIHHYLSRRHARRPSQDS